MHYSNNFLLRFLEEGGEDDDPVHLWRRDKQWRLIHQGWKIECWSGTGWEKAESEAATLKNHLESVTLLKLTVEDRASHLDGALKECMRQIRNLKEQKLHDVIQNKAKQFDKINHEFEANLDQKLLRSAAENSALSSSLHERSSMVIMKHEFEANLDQQLLRSAAENSALSSSLQERSSMVIKLSEKKSQAEAKIEMLNRNIESCGREINSLKYELHINSKELEIRNEEKNMSVRYADEMSVSKTIGGVEDRRLGAGLLKGRGGDSGTAPRGRGEGHDDWRRVGGNDASRKMRGWPRGRRSRGGG
ncbi:hypothetical protein KY290_008164 [Solanum tuberosum]|uniref:Uncharacterized protein n=1 Tax=Solanum tuberosum TaxID=4113 RepID=A0ABQ7W7N3_SOLTU|nr:hypothetical protein KY290_008164 [Solanum tuberosum]